MSEGSDKEIEIFKSSKIVLRHQYVGENEVGSISVQVVDKVYQSLLLAKFYCHQESSLDYFVSFGYRGLISELQKLRNVKKSFEDMEKMHQELGVSYRKDCPPNLETRFLRIHQRTLSALEDEEDQALDKAILELAIKVRGYITKP